MDHDASTRHDASMSISTQAYHNEPADLIARLRDVVGPNAVVTGDALAARPVSYWDSSPTRALALVKPASTADVSAVLRLCHELGQPVVTQGGNTNCVNAADPNPEEVILSTERMTAIEAIDAVGGTATVQAGAVLQVVQEAVAQQGLLFPLDLGARGSCTIGGTIATNAGGINVLRYGMMRELVLGLEVALADGTVLHSMNRMLKNNAGYDLKHMFIGSEGTLGVVTRAVLRLFPQPQSRNTALVALADFDHVTALLKTLQSALRGALTAFEVMWGDYLRGVTVAGAHRAPLSRDHAFYVIFEAQGGAPEADAAQFEAVVARLFEDGVIVDGVMPKSEAERRAIWSIREDFDAIIATKPYYLYDVSLPIGHMPRYVAQVQASMRTRWPDAALFVLGHMADGNLHLFAKPNQQGDFHTACDEAVYTALQPFGGSVSAEHGIGTEKKAWLPASRTPEELAVMRSLKHALDPQSLLNRGRVFDAAS